jgi:hypothetical protein
VQISSSIKSVDPKCLVQLKLGYLEIDQALEIDPSRTMSLFNASGFEKLDFLYFMVSKMAKTIAFF